MFPGLLRGYLGCLWGCEAMNVCIAPYDVCMWASEPCCSSNCRWKSDFVSNIGYSSWFSSICRWKSDDVSTIKPFGMYVKGWALCVGECVNMWAPFSPLCMYVKAWVHVLAPFVYVWSYELHCSSKCWWKCERMSFKTVSSDVSQSPFCACLEPFLCLCLSVLCPFCEAKVCTHVLGDVPKSAFLWGESRYLSDSVSKNRLYFLAK